MILCAAGFIFFGDVRNCALQGSIVFSATHPGCHFAQSSVSVDVIAATARLRVVFTRPTARMSLNVEPGAFGAPDLDRKWNSGKIWDYVIMDAWQFTRGSTELPGFGA